MVVHIKQNEWPLSSLERKAFYFYGMNVVEVLISIALVIRFKGVVKLAAFTWGGYVLERIYDRRFNETVFELSTWIITVSLFVVGLSYFIYKEWRN